MFLFIEGINDIGQQQRSVIQGNSYRGQFGGHHDASSHNPFSNSPMNSSGSVAGLKGGTIAGMFQGQQKMSPAAGFQTAQVVSQPSPNLLHQMNNNSSPHQQYNPPWSNESGGSSGTGL